MLYLQIERHGFHIFRGCQIAVPVLIFMAVLSAVEQEIVRISADVETDRFTCLIRIGRVKSHPEVHILIYIGLLASREDGQHAASSNEW